MIASAGGRAVLAICLGLLAAAAAGGGTTVGRWQLHEITLLSDRGYDNPFTDVELRARFTSPSGEVTEVAGFHDGDGRGGQGDVWRVRFMAETLGAWRWRTVASDPDNAGLHGRAGWFEVVPSTVPGPPAPDPEQPTAWRFANGRHLLWSAGYGLFVAGAEPTHPGVGGWRDYIDWLAARRFSGVLFALQVPSLRTCSTCWKGRAPWGALGDAPPPAWAVRKSGAVDYFVMPWARHGEPDRFATDADDADFERFFLPLWRNVDAIVRALGERGMIAHVWQYGDQTFQPPASSPAEQLYWDYLLRRLGGYWNVVFNDGIDLGEYRSVSWITEWQRYFAAHDPFAHPRSSRHGEDDHGAATWRSMQAANDRAPADVDAWRALLAKRPRKPVTEDDGIRARKGRGIPAQRFRQLAWWSVLAGPGALGATWAGAHEPANYFAAAEAESEGMDRVGYRNRFLLDFDPDTGRAIPFWKLVPRDDLVQGTGVFCAAVPGEHYLLYFDTGSAPRATLDLRDAREPLPARWLDPDTGRTVPGETTQPGAPRTFVRPYPHAAVLYLGRGEVDGAPP